MHGLHGAVAGLGLSVFAGCAFGQAVEGKLSFEAASVKPSGPTSVRNFSRDPGRYSASKAEFLELVFEAYRGQGTGTPLPVTEYDQVTGPAWMEKEEFDVVATFPPGTTREQFREMLRNLLVERFKLVLHHETKVLPIYELVVAKGGLKLKETALVPDPDAPGFQGRPAVDNEGFVVLPPGRPNIASRFMADGGAHITCFGEPMSVVATTFGQPNAAGRRVIDKTGLTGKYDFKLFYRAQFPGTPPPADDDPMPTLEQAVRQQLGLSLVPAKAPFEIIVIDHAEKVPAEN